MSAIKPVRAPHMQALPLPEKENYLSAANSALSEAILEQILPICLSGPLDRGTITAAVHELLEELNPSNAMEGLIVSNLVACHFLTMFQMGKGARAPAPQSQQIHLNLGVKMQRSFDALVHTLMKLRGQQQQKVLVEHVHVHSGAQAIIGQVSGVGRRGMDEEK